MPRRTVPPAVAWVTTWLGAPPVVRLNFGQFAPPFPAVILMILLAAAALAVSVIGRTGQELNLARARQVEVTAAVERLADENRRLAAEIEALDSRNPQVIETLAREHLGLARRGELAAYPSPKP